MKKGRILRIQPGVNPNSSALAGPAVVCLWASVISGAVFLAMDALLRRSKKTPPEGEEIQPVQAEEQTPEHAGSLNKEENE